MKTTNHNNQQLLGIKEAKIHLLSKELALSKSQISSMTEQINLSHQTQQHQHVHYLFIFSPDILT